MDYEEFIENLNKLYTKYFNEQGGIVSNFDANKSEFLGYLSDKIYVKMPKGLKSQKNTIYISSSKKEYYEKGIYSKITCKGSFLIFPDDGRKSFTKDEYIEEVWMGTCSTKTLYKRFDKLFAEMLKLIKSQKNDKLAKVAKKIFLSEITKKFQYKKGN